MNLDREPSPAVGACGIWARNRSQYWLEDDGMPNSLLSQGKPPYAVPLMSDIRRVRWNGLTVASTFAGAGGSCLGYRMAGYRVAWANEVDAKARASYEANGDGAILDPRDVREVSGADVLEACGLGEGELDLLDGSPPCVSFSVAGRREQTWGQVRLHAGIEQRTDDLFDEYIRLVREIKPRTFVAENVAGLVRGVAKGVFKQILAELKASGYDVMARLLDAQWLGVPQTRSRVIFVGVRDDLGLEPTFPQPLPYRYSVRDALPEVDRMVYDTSGQHAPAVLQKQRVHGVVVGKLLDEAAVKALSPALREEWDKLKPGESSKKYFNMVKPRIDGPSGAILASHGTGLASVVHPVERRKFTIAELRRICSFPDDFKLEGSYADQWSCLGNSVPPLMMRAVAEAVRDGVLFPAGFGRRPVRKRGRRGSDDRASP